MSTSALAQPPAKTSPENAALAEALFQEATQAAGNGNYAEACPKFADSHRLDPGGGTVLALAHCYEADGKLASAWAAFEEAVAFAHRDGRKDREAEARERATALAPRISRVELVFEAPLPDMEVQRNGTSLPRSAWQSRLPLDPGPHVFRVSAPRYVSIEETVDVAEEGKTYRVELPALVPVPEPPTADPDPPAPSPPAARAPVTRTPAGGATAASEASPPVLGYTLLGAGVVAAGIGTWFGVQALSDAREADRICPESECEDERGVALSKDATRSGRVSTASFALAAVLSGGGHLLHPFHRRASGSKHGSHGRARDRRHRWPRRALGGSIRGTMTNVFRALTAAAVLQVSAGCAVVSGAEEKKPPPAPADDLDRPGRPPSRPESGPSTFEKEAWFAMRALYLGANVRGTAELDPDAWRDMGWDLDGVDSTEESARGACTSKATIAEVADGDAGRDNMLGKHVYQYVASFDPQGEKVTNEGIEFGSSTLLLRLEDVNDWHNDPHVRAAIYISTHDRFEGPTPEWDGNDVRDVSTIGFHPGSNVPFVRFDDGYIKEGTFVSGDRDTSAVELAIPVYPLGNAEGAVLLVLRGRSGWMTADLGAGAGGVGSMGYTALQTEIRDGFFNFVAHALACPAVASIVHKQMEQFFHLKDTQSVDTGAPRESEACDSLSWGLEMTWAPIGGALIDEPVHEDLAEDCEQR